MELKELVGQHKLDCAARTDVRHPFDADREGIAFSLDDKVYMVFEDNNDGYRSCAAPVLVASGYAFEFWDPEYINRPVTVRHVTHGEYSGENDVIEMIDNETGRLWMRVGTANIDDYYPWFVAEWRPMPPP